jgi:DNA-binding NarL/FixJ family response regulator
LTSEGKVRVAICDDHGLFRHGVSEMLSLTEDLEVLGEASTHEEAVAVVSELSPDVVLLDLEMPGRIGADESMRRMLDLSSPPSVVVFTMHDEPGMMGRFLARGAAAYFPKSAEMGELVEAVRDAARLRSPGTPGGSAPLGAQLTDSYVPDGTEMEFSFSGEESAIPGPVGTQVYLEMREAVRNAVRHSDCARIGLTLEVLDGALRARLDEPLSSAFLSGRGRR